MLTREATRYYVLHVNLCLSSIILLFSIQRASVTTLFATKRVMIAGSEDPIARRGKRIPLSSGQAIAPAKRAGGFTRAKWPTKEIYRGTIQWC
jgi:hypothetical protein